MQRRHAGRSCMPDDTGGWNRGDDRVASNERRKSSRKTTRMQCT
ncbi:hypothetical protein MYA_0570 [Burkholderia sp. KJ006]|nr:hypothetical protein MYA_0570 [Burkholderia sp. KJ006]